MQAGNKYPLKGQDRKHNSKLDTKRREKGGEMYRNRNEEPRRKRTTYFHKVKYTLRNIKFLKRIAQYFFS